MTASKGSAAQQDAHWEELGENQQLNNTRWYNPLGSLSHWIPAEPLVANSTLWHTTVQQRRDQQLPPLAIYHSDTKTKACELHNSPVCDFWCPSQLRSAHVPTQQGKLVQRVEKQTGGLSAHRWGGNFWWTTPKEVLINNNNLQMALDPEMFPSRVGKVCCLKSLWATASHCRKYWASWANGLSWCKSSSYNPALFFWKGNILSNWSWACSASPHSPVTTYGPSRWIPCITSILPVLQYSKAATSSEDHLKTQLSLQKGFSSLLGQHLIASQDTLN